METINPMSYIAAATIADDGENLWMAAVNKNGLFRVGKEDRQVEFLGYFSGEKKLQKYLYQSVHCIHGKVFCLPAEAKKITIYDIATHTFSEYEFNLADQNINGAKFWKSVQIENKIFAFGYKYPGVLCIDADTMEYMIIDGWIEETDKHQACAGTGYLADGYALFGHDLYVPIGCMPAVLKINTDTFETNIIKINCSLSGIGGLRYGNGFFYMVGRGNSTRTLVTCNKEMDCINEYELPEGERDKMDPFYAPIINGDDVFLLPIAARYVYKFNIKDKKFTHIKEMDTYIDNVPQGRILGWRTIAPFLAGDDLYFQTGTDLRWCRYNLNTQDCMAVRILYENNTQDYLEEFFKERFRKSVAENKILYEKQLPLNWFLQFI